MVEMVIAFKWKNFEGKVSVLEEKNRQLIDEVTTLQAKVDYYSGKVKNIDEGRALLKFYREKMTVVKTKIGQYKAEANQARIATLKELDRIRMQLGNNGFFVKGGKAVKVDKKRYDAGQPDDIPAAATPSGESSVKIDVKFVD